MPNTSFNTTGILISGSGAITGSFSGLTAILASTVTGLRDLNGNQIIGPNAQASYTINSSSAATFITPTGSFNINGINITVVDTIGIGTTSSVTLSSASLAPYITPTGSFNVNGVDISIIGNIGLGNTASLSFLTSSIIPLSSRTGSFIVNGITFTFRSGSLPTNTSDIIYLASSSITNVTSSIITSFNISKSIAPYSASIQYVTASALNNGVLFTSTITGSILNSFYYSLSGSTLTYFSGGTDTYLNQPTLFYIKSGSTPAATLGNVTASFNVSKSISPYTSYLQYITASATSSNSLVFSSTLTGSIYNLYYTTLGGTTTYFSGGKNNYSNTPTNIYVLSGSVPSASLNNIITAFNVSNSIAPYSSSLINLTASLSSSTGIFINISSSISGTIGNTYYVIINGNTGFFSGGINATGSLIFPANLTLPLGISSASISNGAVMFYPI
jgi:hypothetical protein